MEPRDGVDRGIGRIVADLGLREEHRVPVARGVFAAFRHDRTGELLPEADQLEPGRRRLARNRVTEQEGRYRGEGGLRGVGARNSDRIGDAGAVGRAGRLGGAVRAVHVRCRA